MKNALYALPVVALCATAAVAQTDTTTGTGTDMTGDRYGTSWPLSIGSTFFSEEGSSTLRTGEELSSGWQSLSQEDRDMIEADCQSFMAMQSGTTGGTAATGTGDAATGTGDTGAATGATGTAETGTGTGDAAATGDAGATAGTDGSTAATGATGDATTEVVGYDMAQMQAICGAIEGL